MIVGGRDTKDPEKNPKKMQIVMMPATPVTGIKQRMRSPEIIAQGMIMFKAPSLSAIKFGIIRPKTEAELRTERR